MTAPAAAPASGPIAPAVARLAPRPPADPFAFAAVLEFASRRGGESGPPSSGRGTAGSLERHGAGRALGWTDGSSFAAQRQRALVGFAIRLAGRLDDERTPASRGQFAFARLACDESPEIREQRRLHCRRRQSGDRRATGRRTRFPLRRRHFRGRDREPDARDQHAIRAGRRFRRRPCGPIRFNGESALSPAFRRPSLRRKPRPTPFRRSRTPRPRRRSPLARARLQHIAGAARGRPRTKPRTADKRPRSPRLRLPPGSRPPPQSTRQRNQAARRPTVGRQIRLPSPRRQQRKQTCSARRCRRLSPQGRRSNSMARPPAPDPQTSRPARARSALAPRPRLRRSARSMSIFRPAASRMSR